jgi:hypothetical protein
VDVLDLFRGEGPGIDESVELSTDNSTWTRYQSAGLAGGYTSTGFSSPGTTELYMRGFADQVSDVALARITYAPVPEPTVLSLLAAGPRCRRSSSSPGVVARRPPGAHTASTCSHPSRSSSG